MNFPEENSLLQEILADEKLSALRRESLTNGIEATRRARHRRRAAQFGMLAMLPVLLILTFLFRKPNENNARPAAPPPAQLASAARGEPQKESSVTTISDEELFALFPGRALALIGEPGQQELVFLDAPGN